MRELNIIMPVKDSMETAREAITDVVKACQNGQMTFTVYNDNSNEENTCELQRLSQQLGFRLIHMSDLTDHPSPNYRITLQHAQQQALAAENDLVVVESDVMIQPDTLSRLQQQVCNGVGMVAAVTVDDMGTINFPYEYAVKMKGTVVPTKKRFSFCCTLLSLEFLKAYSFNNLDPEKSWYDVFISHKSVELGFRNLLMLNNRVLHKPHSSRPWKLLKYTHPLKYYWQKLTRKRDRI